MVYPTCKGPSLLRVFLLLLAANLLPALCFAASHIHLGVVGVGAGQSVRFHAVSLEPPPDPDIPPGPCRVQLALLDLNGRPIVDAKGVPAVQSGELLPGHSLTLSFNSAGLVHFGQRVAVRGQVTLVSDAKVPPDPCGQMAPSLEVIDDFTGRTEGYVSPGDIAGFNPQPDPPAIIRVAFDYPLIGAAVGEQARLHIVSVPAPAGPAPTADVPPGPCRVTLSFLDRAGQVLTNRRGVPITEDLNLTPGDSAELTLNANNVAGSSGRVVFRAQVTSPTDTGLPPDPCRLFTSNVEIIDSFSARTSQFVSPAEIHGFNPQPDPPGDVAK